MDEQSQRAFAARRDAGNPDGSVFPAVAGKRGPVSAELPARGRRCALLCQFHAAHAGHVPLLLSGTAARGGRADCLWRCAI